MDHLLVASDKKMSYRGENYQETTYRNYCLFIWSTFPGARGVFVRTFASSRFFM